MPPTSDGTAFARKIAVSKAVAYIQENLKYGDEDLSLNRLAKEGGYSKSHFIRIFESVTGKTPNQYLRIMRIEWAKSMLLNSRRSITEIGLEVGYDSFSSFSRVFKDSVGVSPSKFRSTMAFEKREGSKNCGGEDGSKNPPPRRL